MLNARSVTCAVISALLLSGCAVFGSKTVDEKLEGELSNLMLDHQILETRLSLTEDRVISLQTQVNEIHESAYSGAQQATPEVAAAHAEAVAPAAVKSAPKKEEQRPAATAGAEAAYKAALDTFMSRKYKQAEGMFAEFIKKYPKSSLMPNAGYWLGESHYAQKRYDEAILNFQSVVKNYPRHQKAADSLLKTGYSYEKLGDKHNARFYLEQVLELYPDTRAATLARPMLDSLG